MNEILVRMKEISQRTKNQALSKILLIQDHFFDIIVYCIKKIIIIILKCNNNNNFK